MAEAGLLLKQCSIAGVVALDDDREKSCFHPSPNEYFATSARVARSSVMSLGAESQAHRKRSSGAGGRRRLSRGLSRSRSGMLTKEERAARRTVRELQMMETAYREQKKRMAVRKKAALAQQRAWACAQGGAGGQTKVAATALLLAQDELHGSPFRDSGGGAPGSPPAASGLMSRLTRLSRRSRLRGQRRYGGGPPSPVLPRPAEGVAWGVVRVDADLFFDPVEREAVLRRKRRTRVLLRDRSSLQGTGTCLVLGGLQQQASAAASTTTTYAEHVALCVAEAVLLLQEDRDAPLFTQLRHPLPREDRVLRFTLPPTTAPHIVVFYKGNGYLIEVLEVGGGERRVAPPPPLPQTGGSGGSGTADLLQQAKEEAARTKPPPVRAISAYELHKHLQLIMEGAAEDSLFLSNGKVAYSSSYLEEADRSSRAGGGAAGRRQAGLSAHPVPYSQVSRRSRDEAASLVPLVDRDGQPLEVRRQRSLIEVEECDGESFDDDDSWGWSWEGEEDEEYEEAEEDEEEEYESDEEEVAPYRQAGYHHHHAEPEHLTDVTYLNLCLNTAAFIVTIAPDGDEDPPDSPGDVAARVLRRSDDGGGGGGSQALLDVWYGKALHLVFFPNKRTAVLTEPTIVTEHTSAVFATKLHKRVVAREPTYRERNELWAYISRLEFIAEAEWFCLSFKELVKELEAGRLSELNNKTAPRAALETLLFARLRDSLGRVESKRRLSQMTRQSELRLHQLIEETRKQKGAGAPAAKSALGGGDGGRGPSSLHPAFRDLYPHVIVTANVYDPENPILHNPHHPFDKAHEGNAGFISFAPGESSGATKPFSLFRRTFWEPFSDLVTSTIPLTMMTAKVHDTKPYVAPRRVRRAPPPNTAEAPQVSAASRLAKLPERSAGLVTRMKAAYRLPARAHRSVEYFEVGVQSLARRGLDTAEKRELWMTVVLHYAYHTLHQGAVRDPVHRALLHTYDEANASVPHDVANGTSARLTRLCDSFYCGGAGHPVKKSATRDLTCQLFAYLEGGLRGIMERGDVSAAGARAACELHTIAIPEDCAPAISAIAPSNPRPISAALAASFCLMPDSVLVSLSAPEALLKPFTVHVRGAIRTVRDLCNPKVSLGVLED